MGLSNLSRFCFAFFLVPSLVLAAPVSTEVAAGTTTYKVTQRTIATPSSVAVSAAKDITPYVKPTVTKLPAVGSQVGGLAQATRGDLIVAIKDNLPAKSPFTGKFNVSATNLKMGAKTLFRASPAIQAGSLGLQALLDATDWYFDDHGELLKPAGGGDPTSPDYWGSAPEGITYSGGGIYGSSDVYEVAQAVVAKGIGCTAGECTLVGLSDGTPNCLDELRQNCTLKIVALKNDRPHSAGYFSSISVSNTVGSIQCPAPKTYDKTHFGCVGVSGDFEPVSEEELIASIDSLYDPQPSDWEQLFPYIEPDSFTVDPIPELELEPTVQTKTNLDTGVLVVTSTTPSYKFETSSNDSSQPKIDLDSKTRVDEYTNGVLTGSSSTSTKYPSVPSENYVPPSTGTGGSGNNNTGGGGGGTAIEFPTFCSWASVVCDFIDWYKEPIGEPEPDLSQIIIDNDDFVKHKNISFGSKSCPADYSVRVDFIGKDINISYQPFCDLAALMYFFIMASTYVSAAYITLGVVRG
ncbi:MAG: 50-kDa virion protein [Inoviridae sp.]|nr:MAG: 50-kDa virion protein [Inoviridae sp.]